jgi:hypothetical protein
MLRWSARSRVSRRLPAAIRQKVYVSCDV